MKRWSFPLWLLRDAPALLGVLASFWSLVIFGMINGAKAMRAGTAGKQLRDHIALLLALAEARLDYALWRRAYRRLGWHPRVLKLRPIEPTALWSDTCERIRTYANAFRNMNHVVDAYVENLRERYSISEREAVSCSAHGPVRTPLATSMTSSLALRRGEVNRRAFAARRWGLRARLRTRTAAKPHPRSETSHLASITRETAPPCLALTFCSISTTYASTLEPTHMKPSKPA